MKKCLGRSLLNTKERMDTHMKDGTYSQDALVCVHIVMCVALYSYLP